MPTSATIGSLIERALVAYDGLATLGESSDEEWGYVNDLTDAWRTRLDVVASERGDEPVTRELEEAVDRAIDEIGRIDDPHRAIDWLSTYPQVVLVALRETP